MASSRVSIAAITVAAENVMDSPTLVTDVTIASFAGLPGVQEVAEQAAAEASRPWVVLAFGGVLPGPQLLADPEHQEKAVVRARAQDQHDQQELRDRGHLEPVLGGLGDQRPGNGDRQQRR